MEVYNAIGNVARRAIEIVKKGLGEPYYLMKMLPVEQDERFRKIEVEDEWLRKRLCGAAERYLSEKKEREDLAYKLNEKQKTIGELEVRLAETEVQLEKATKEYKNLSARIPFYEENISELTEGIRGQSQILRHVKSALAGLRRSYAEEVAKLYLELHPRDFVIVTNHRDLIAGVSKKAEKVLHQSTKALVGKDVYSLIQNPTRIRASLQMRIKAVSSEPVLLPEVIVQNPETGREFKTSVIVTPLYSGGEITRPEERVYSGAMIQGESWFERKRRTRAKKQREIRQTREESAKSKGAVEIAMSELKKMLNFKKPATEG